MSPGSIMESTLPNTNSSLFSVPKLADDGSNWITDGRASKPTPFDVDTKTKAQMKPDGSALVKQQIFSTISDRLLLRVQKFENAGEVWTEVCQIHEGKTELVQIDMRRRLQETRCEEGGDVKVHFGELLRLRESLAGMGAALDDRDFHAIILGSLPESYRPLLSSISAAAKITKTPLTSYELISIVSEEFEHRQLTELRRPNKKTASSALAARETRGKGRTSTPTSAKNNPDITCFNCDRKGHYKTDCWRPGGGKEGQGPNQMRRRAERPQKQAANAAAEAESHDQYAFVTSDLASVAEDLRIPIEKRGAIVDSGATSHFCPDRSRFTNFVAIPPQDVHTADGSPVPVAMMHQVC